jgi:hypothetical protein
MRALQPKPAILMLHLGFPMCLKPLVTLKLGNSDRSAQEPQARLRLSLYAVLYRDGVG